MKNHEYSFLPFISKSSQDLKTVFPCRSDLNELILNMKRSIDYETDVVKQRKKILILEDYLIISNFIKTRL